MAKKSLRKSKKQILPFNRRLVLNRFMLKLCGAENFTELAASLNSPDNEGIGADGVSNICAALIPAARKAQLTEEMLLKYDRNIQARTREIQGRRAEGIKWNYYQYLALLFTEIYLDRFFNFRVEFLAALNKFCDEFNAELEKFDAEYGTNTPPIKPYQEADLRKLALWCATGSGKTLLMHANIKQYLHYAEKAKHKEQPNKILLICPNEGLSQQHKQEFLLAGIGAQIFSKSAGGAGPLEGRLVEILEITKLAEISGEKTIAVEAFGDNNLVLVDEGHRGASGDVWGKNRRALAAGGFTFEYSATLGQAVSGNADLAQEYAKSIIFDYSYRYFYGDGYGKDYKILNFPDEKNAEVNKVNRELYLTACLLQFYQQKILFTDKRAQAKRFSIENPLMIFVGGSVNAVRKEGGKETSDIADIILFLARFIASAAKAEVCARIKKLLSGRTDLLAEDKDIFANAFPYLREQKQSPEEIYAAILHCVFNGAGGAFLHIQDLKGFDGEISLSLGQADEPFGLINVGDSAKLCKLLERLSHKRESNIYVGGDRNFGQSLFYGLNSANSKINILIGSKKFTEGWNSYRVATMGLMNIGKSEGSQIIQLFGRGVRLHGLDNCLKRHSALRTEGLLHSSKTELDEYLTPLETLNIFGINADYMEQFKKILDEEAIPNSDNTEIIKLPIIVNPPKAQLKIIAIAKGQSFKQSGEKPALSMGDSKEIGRISLDYYPRLSMRASGKAPAAGAAVKHKTHLMAGHIAFLDIDALWLDLQAFKAERGWSNLCISKAAIKALLEKTDWYELYIPAQQLEFDDYGKVLLWQSIAAELLMLYCVRFYTYKQAEWEAPRREYQNLDCEKDGNFFKAYEVEVNKEQTALIAQLEELAAELKTGKKALPQGERELSGGAAALFFDRHLYQPLLAGEGEDFSVKPVPLNEGEADFIRDLQNYYQHNKGSYFSGKELYLLRNMSRGRGIGFFEAGQFYPDFIMWLLAGDKQYISFIDPKGLRNLSSDDPKIQFAETVKHIEADMAEKRGDKNIILNSFILSNTPHDDLLWDNKSEEELAAKHIFFQKDGDSAYIEQIFSALQESAAQAE